MKMSVYERPVILLLQSIKEHSKYLISNFLGFLCC